MTARGPNVVHLFPRPSSAADEAGKEALALVDDEPILGPLAREIFKIDEERGNMPPSLFVSVRYDELARRCTSLEEEIIACRAETMGGLIWRLHQLLNVADLSPYAAAILRAAIDDAKALAGIGFGPAGGAA